MRICHVDLLNFRGVKKGSVVLPSHAAILGPNNVGKSTIAEALILLFGRESLIRPLCDWDFHGGVPEPHSRFQVIVTVTDFGDGSDVDPARFPDWFVGENAATPVWWDEAGRRLVHQTDPPEGTKLAARICLAGCYDEESCEFETKRFFYDGECDPFTEDYRHVPNSLLRDLGVFLLPSERQWEKLLAFGSSTFLKVLREHSAIPGEAIETLKNELRSKVTKVEDAQPLSEILLTAEKELRSFLMIGDAGRLIYRPTSLDAISVLRSLAPHLAHTDEFLLPVARSGSGMIALQSFILLLAFSEHRIASGHNFILVADEPELHLHPSLHQRLVQRIRAASTQSIVATQSPGVAAAYQPSEVIFLRNLDGELVSTPLRTEPVRQIVRDSVRKLYLNFRRELYDALMGAAVLVPEGTTDWRWLALWQRIAEACPEAAGSFELRPLSIIPTSDAAIVETYQEIAKFRPDAVPVVDGDKPGDDYRALLMRLGNPPHRILQYGQGAGVESLAAWILEPWIATPSEPLAELLPDETKRDRRALLNALVASSNKKNSELHESLAWESLAIPECGLRAAEFFHDVGAIVRGGKPTNPGWSERSCGQSLTLFTATHVARA